MKKLLLLVVYAIPAFAAPVAPLVQSRVNLAQIKLPIEFGQIITANGAHCPSMLACPFGVSSGPIWANWHVDGSGNLLVAAGGSPVASGALTCPSAGACPLGLTPGGAWSFLNVDASGNLLVALTGGGSVTSVFTRTGAVVATSGDYTCAQVTNCPTVLPTTAPAAGKIPVGNAGGTAYAPVSVSGDSTITSAGLMTNTGLNNTSLAGLSTGILKNTTTTGVPSIAVLADIAGLFTGTGLVRNNGASSELSGDCTTSGSNATTCTKATGPTLTISSAGNGNGAVALSGNTSGTATFTAPAVAGTTTNLVTSSNGIGFPDGTFGAPSIAFSAEAGTGFYRVATGQIAFVLPTNTVAIRFLSSGVEVQNAGVFQFGSGNAATSSDTGMSRLAAGLAAFGTGSTGSVAGFAKSAMTSAITSADVTCGTGGTISSCTTATTITGLTFTLPLFATNWAMDCDLVVGQATAATANQWLIQTATNGVTNTTASYTMATAATASAFGAVTDQASTTTAFQIAPSWTLGGTATKMPVHIHAMFEGVSVSGTVINLQVIAPTVGDLLTIYRGASCSLHP